MNLNKFSSLLNCAAHNNLNISIELKEVSGNYLNIIRSIPFAFVNCLNAFSFDLLVRFDIRLIQFLVVLVRGVSILLVSVQSHTLWLSFTPHSIKAERILVNHF